MKTNESPSSLSDCGLLGAGHNSAIKLQQPAFVQQDGFYLCFFYMAAIIHMVRPTRAEYVSLGLNVVYFLENQLTSTVERVNAIWEIHVISASGDLGPVTSAHFGDLGPVTSAHFFSSRPSLLTLYSPVTFSNLLIDFIHKKKC